ncbi:MAG TPA: aspartate/glutamate racemase family protein [Chloroflexaceae bacterium]|nr:aspartate/glutamate racemase family protein [Chloroflexaceae bacterium]
MARLAIIHTTTATVELLRSLAAELLPEVAVVNIVDDSILPRLAANGGDLSAVAPRVLQYARFAEEGGADVILEACSSIGELVEEARRSVRTPVVRIDEAMAERAIARGPRVGVAATLATTLAPTCRLLERQAAQSGLPISLRTALVDDAYRRLMAGDREGHDAALAAALAELAPSVDCVVLAQASMARVLPALPEEQRAKFLTSPRLAMERVRDVLAALPGRAP